MQIYQNISRITIDRGCFTHRIHFYTIFWIPSILYLRTYALSISYAFCAHLFYASLHVFEFLTNAKTFTAWLLTTLGNQHFHEYSTIEESRESWHNFICSYFLKRFEWKGKKKKKKYNYDTAILGNFLTFSFLFCLYI